MRQPIDGRCRFDSRRPATACALAAIALLLAACGSSDPVADGDRSTPQQTGVSDAERAGPERTGSGQGEAAINGSGDGLDRLGYADERRPIDPDNIPPVDQPRLESPEERLPRMTAAVAEAIEKAAVSPDLAILDVAGIVDDGPTAEEIASFGDGHTRTSSGVLVILDQPAGLACANIEIALTEIDEGRRGAAADHITSAVDRTLRSELQDIRGWSATLAASLTEAGIDVATLVGFLSVCLDGGYVL